MLGVMNTTSPNELDYLERFFVRFTQDEVQAWSRGAKKKSRARRLSWISCLSNRLRAGP